MTTSVYVFSSTSCEPCKHMKPVFQELKEDYGDYHWRFIDIHSDPSGYTAYYKVTNIPSMVVVKDDMVMGSHKGTTAMGYVALLKKVR